MDTRSADNICFFRITVRSSAVGIADPSAAVGGLASETALLRNAAFLFVSILLNASVHRIATRKKSDACASPFCLRRDRDSNPRSAFGAYTLSRRAPSTTRPSLLIFSGGKSTKNCDTERLPKTFFRFFIFLEKNRRKFSEPLKKYCTFARLNFKALK